VVLAQLAHRPLARRELRVRATNQAAIALYRKLGFIDEGRFRKRIAFQDGTYVDDLAMAWFPARSDGAG
jgi:ribosomal protein S18 acetylase RimI-like enzyme